MKKLVKILVAVLVIAVMMTVAVGCKSDEGTEAQTTGIITTEKTKTTKKPYIPPEIPTDPVEDETTEEPKQEEETGPIPLVTDEETRFSEAVDMH